MEKVRKFILPALCAILAIGGGLSYLKKGDVVITKPSESPEIAEISVSYPQTEQIIDESNSASETQIKDTDGKINLNTASAEELQTAPGIGPSKAEAIIKYRTQYGNFSSVDELIEVKGIGEKTLVKIRDYFVVK